MEKDKLGTYVASLRKSQGMTQKDLAELLGVTDKAVSKWERGLSFPDISMLEPLSEVLGVSILELLKGESIPVEEPITKEEAIELTKNTIDISDSEITRKHQKNRLIILTGCVVVMLLCSLLLNLWNFLSDARHKTVLTEDLAEYETTLDQTGNTVFTDPDAAYHKILEECSENEDTVVLKEYLEILKNSMNRNNEEER